MIRLSYLNNIGQDFHWSQSHSHSFHGVHECLDQMGRRFKNVRPDEVHEMREGILAAEPKNS